MTETNIDNFPVVQLLDRYLIGKTQLYNRLKALDIKPQIQNGKSYVTLPQLKLLDELQEFLTHGGTINQFIAELLPELVSKEIEPTLESITPYQTANELDFIKVLLILEEFHKHNWLITSKQLAYLLGVTPSCFYGKTYYNYRGFVLKRLEDNTRESTWEVMKY